MPNNRWKNRVQKVLQDARSSGGGSKAIWAMPVWKNNISLYSPRTKKVWNMPCLITVIGLSRWFHHQLLMLDFCAETFWCQSLFSSLPRIWKRAVSFETDSRNKQNSFCELVPASAATPIKSSFRESAGTLGMSDRRRLGEVLNQVLNWAAPAFAGFKRQKLHRGRVRIRLGHPAEKNEFGFKREFE